jgi:hypothetical protein
MKFRILIAIMVATICLLPIDAGGNFRFNTNVLGKKLSGWTAYTITFSEYEPSIYAYIVGESKLEFPLDVFMTGLDAGIDGNLTSGMPWSLNLGFSKNIGDPDNDMKDSDWISVPSWGYREKFSYTESDAELNAFVLDVRGRMGLFGSPKGLMTEGLIGYRYQRFTFALNGVRGWQLDEYGDRLYFDEYRGEKVLDYEVSYHIPYIGGGAQLPIIPSIMRLNAQLAYSPSLTYANDYDDHVLRNKEAESNCHGYSMIAGIHTVWTPMQPKSGLHWSVEFGYEYMVIDTEGKQRQHWYGDDPVSEEDDTGQTIADIDAEIACTTHSMYVLVGFLF